MAIRHRYYTVRRPPFKRVHLMAPGGLTRMCDVIAILKSADSDSGAHSADVMSPFSSTVLFSTAAAGGLDQAAESLGEAIFAAVDRGTPLHERLLAERAGHRAAHPLPPAPPPPPAAAAPAKALSDEERQDAEGAVEP